MEGMRPQILGRLSFICVMMPGLPPFSGMGEVNLKGYSTVLTIDLDILAVVLLAFAKIEKGSR